MILLGSPLFFFYLVLFAPTVWLYRVYQARWRLRNQNAIYIMHSLVIILSIFFVKMFDVLYILRGYSEKPGWSGGAMVLGKLPVPGRPTIWIQ